MPNRRYTASASPAAADTGNIINVQVLGNLGIDNEINAEVIRVERNGLGLRFLYPDYIHEKLH